MRLIASASSTRHDGSYPLIPLTEPQTGALRPRPDTAYRPPAGPANLDMGVSMQAEQDSTIARPSTARPNSRRSIGGAALRVPLPEPPAVSARPAVAGNLLALPDDQAAGSRLPPKARRTSSVSMLSGRGPSASGAARDQAEQPAVRRPSAISGSIRERTLPESLHRVALRLGCYNWHYISAQHVATGRASSLISNGTGFGVFPSSEASKAMSLAELIAQAQMAGEPSLECVFCA